MRHIMTITIPVETGNQAIKSGKMATLIESTLRSLNAEASYFYAEGGKRHAIVVFDLKDLADIPVIAEPLFIGLNAGIDFHPCMNVEDLQKGFKKMAAGV